MRQPHDLQLTRLEQKYIIPQDVALAVRDFVSSYLEIDEFGATQPDLSYPVHSLYLDSDDLRIYWGTINGDKNRYKLRLRFYENRPGAPVYFEIKRRMNNAILKQRGAVHREAVNQILGGQLPAPSQLVSADPSHQVAIQRFVELMTSINAKPKAHVAYRREAWVQPDDNTIRVTIDRQTLCGVDQTSELNAELVQPYSVFGKMAVLELKFTGRFPQWFSQLVRSFGLHQGSAAKFADGVALMGESLFSPFGAPAPSAAHSGRRSARLKELEQKCHSIPLYSELKHA